MEQVFNYIKVAIRSLFKFRTDSVLNVFGLSIGITISIVVLMYIRYELAYDKSYSNSERTYRAITKGTIGDVGFESAMTPQVLSDFLKTNFSEVETATRIVRGANKLVTYNEMKFNEDNFFYADSSFFSLFDVPFIIGDAQNSLNNEEDIVITRQIADKYFGTEDPIGKLLKLDNGLFFYVSGVCEPLPSNSHFHFDFIASQQSIKKLYSDKKYKDTKHKTENWLKVDWYTYFALKNNTDKLAFEQKLQKQLHIKVKDQISRIVEKENSSAMGIKAISFHIQPIEDIHLHSKLDGELESNSKYLYVGLFLSLAIFALLITCINFMNLTTARASLRIKEIGVRKLVGTSQKSLMVQFVVEAITYSFVALFIGLVLVELLLPFFNSLFELNLRLNRIEGRFDLLYVILITFMIGIISGIYPALAFSKLKEVSIFKDGFRPNKKGLFVRGILAATQVLVPTFLIILSLAMIWQIQFLKNKDLGFNSDNIIVVERGYSIGKKFEEFKTRLKAIPGILEVSACTILPGEEASITSFNYSGRNGDKIAILPLNFVEKDFFKTINVKLDAGSVWKTSKSKMAHDLVINQKAKNFLKMNKPLGQRISFIGNNEINYSIKGVVKDFHFEPIQFPIRPLVLMDIPKGSYYDNLLIKTSPKRNNKEIINDVNDLWDIFTDKDPFEYKMLNETLSNNLKEESFVLKITLVFLILSMLVGWLGLRAFAAYVAEMKDKEYISKKVIGASPTQIFKEFFMTISQFVLPGILLSIPVSLVVITLWLNGFAYYSRLPLLLMLAIAGVVWGISFLLVLVHSGKNIKACPTQMH